MTNTDTTTQTQTPPPPGTEKKEVARGVALHTRFTTTDMPGKGQWVMQRMRERWTHLSERYLIGWINGVSSSNEYFFVHTKHAVLLAQKVSEYLDVLPTVKVWFVLVMQPEEEEHLFEGADLLIAAEKWARDIGAGKLVDIEVQNDLPSTILQARLGKLKTDKTTYLKLA